jgi:hypothetical protein
LEHMPGWLHDSIGWVASRREDDSASLANFGVDASPPQLPIQLLQRQPRHETRIMYASVRLGAKAVLEVVGTYAALVSLVVASEVRRTGQASIVTCR